MDIPTISVQFPSSTRLAGFIFLVANNHHEYIDYFSANKLDEFAVVSKSNKLNDITPSTILCVKESLDQRNILSKYSWV
jgi:hypothetical protein